MAVLVLVSAIVLSIARPGPAYAHAGYERSEPAPGDVIPEPPDEVHVWFTQVLFHRPGANALEVYGPDGARVDQGDARIDEDDRKHMVVSLERGLGAGTYTVRWRTLSADDREQDSGEFAFTVDPAAATTPRSSPTATPRPQPTPTLAPSPAPTPASEADGGLLWLGGLLATLVLVGAAIWVYQAESET